MLPRSLWKLFFVPLLTSACYAWSPVGLAPTASRELAPHSRVVGKGGAQVTLRTGRVTADSIIGLRGDTTGRFAISRDSVARVEEQHFRPVRTIAALAGVGMGVVAALFVAFATSGDLVLFTPQ
jgi:hypothetical protein